MSRFAKAKANAGTTKKKGRKKAARPEVSIEGLTDLAAVSDAIKALEGLKAALKDDVYEQITDTFVEDGLATHKQPVNFTGLDVGSTASCQLRKRTSRSFLKPAELELLEEHGISFEEHPDTVFYINKKYEDDEVLMDKISKALDKVKAPEDFLLCKPSKFTTTDDSLREVFEEATNEEDLATLLGIVSTVATRVKYEGSVTDALDRVRDMMEDDG